MSDQEWARHLTTLDRGLDLLTPDVQWCMREILEGHADIERIKQFLLALKNKGETAEEVGALIAQMHEHAAPITISERAVDTVGTGGDGAHTINISTTAAIIAAAAGAKVIKHGNRAASSKSGSADLLEALGVCITLDGKGVEKSFAQLGIGFCFAPVFHPAMRFAAPARKELGVPTVFNILGPLANPAKPQAAAIGVANDRMHLVMAQVLGDRGVDGFVFRGDDGLDEITLATTTSVLTIGQGEIRSDLIDPLDFSIDRAPISALAGGDANENARITTAIFAGERGAPRDAVVLNAAAAIAAYDGQFELSVHDRMSHGVEKAIKAIDSGAASILLAKWAQLSQSLS
ncbi:MAG: anthranilate phosphoribosyltransferase [Actinobacteria bacterium]|uniref:anthranilate phosphoribosyltransferase n=1 Tax=freshwater metagenome TaxID=449393 RepID=A0A6J7V841_9ZZZZ|nr:anthranilate phosphoribosyltransferase [Actinomycetota bacterium]MSY35955.1 anthranilate phosphoribosyltransferase [Actinomycetota bacterium]MTA72558.1 anthranilate phosphoribosyltransferase [Actinomycetota bacterium]MTB29196.1 anthranilate phosphoribosyltransferase [Actinomycetota bacterium]